MMKNWKLLKNGILWRSSIWDKSVTFWCNDFRYDIENPGCDSYIKQLWPTFGQHLLHKTFSVIRHIMKYFCLILSSIRHGLMALDCIHHPSKNVIFSHFPEILKVWCWFSQQVRVSFFKGGYSGYGFWDVFPRYLIDIDSERNNVNI